MLKNTGSGSEGENQSGSKTIVRISVAAIGIGMAVMLLTVAIVTGFQNEIRDKVIGFGSHINITNYDNNSSFEPIPIKYDEKLYQDMKAMPDIKNVQVYATKSGIIKTKKDNEGILLRGIGRDYNWDFIKHNLKEGDVFSLPDSAPSKQIVVSKNLCDRLGLKLGQKMIVYFVTKQKGSGDAFHAVEYEQRVRDFYISGIYDTEFEEYDRKTVFVDIEQIKALNYWENDQVGGYEIILKNYKLMEEVGDELNDRAGIGLVAQTAKELNPSIFTWLELMDVNAWIVIGLLLLIAAINMISALLILILERTNMIGILKAMGSSNRSIQLMFLYNGARLLAKGLLWGNGLALLIMLIQKQFGLFTLDKQTYYVSVVPVNIHITYFLLLNLGTLLICMLMLLIPSLIISKITPVKAIRFA